MAAASDNGQAPRERKAHRDHLLAAILAVVVLAAFVSITPFAGADSDRSAERETITASIATNGKSRHWTISRLTLRWQRR